MKFIITAFTVLSLLCSVTIGATIQLPALILDDVAYEMHITDKAARFKSVSLANESFPIVWEDGVGTVAMPPTSQQQLVLSYGNETFSKPINPMPGWLSVVPPLLAILLALVFKEVLSSLFVGILTGAGIIGYYTEGVGGMFAGGLHIVDHYLLESVVDSGHASVILFSLLIGSLVALISKNGGMKGVVNAVSKYANTPRNGQLATWFLGILIFFDDYANTLVVGNTMRPVMDKLKVSREKFAYLVDSTAAPIAAIAFVTTWIGAELGYIADGIAQIPELDAGPYAIFFQSLRYSFYPILTLIFMLMLILRGVDYGPMHAIEQRSLKATDKRASTAESHDMEAFEPSSAITPKAYNAIIPVAIVIFGTMAGLYYTGLQATSVIPDGLSGFQLLSMIIGNADSYTALLWSSMSAVLVAFLLTVGQRILSLGETAEALISGIKTMMSAVIILVLAWSLALITEEMHTAAYLTSSLSASISPWMIPTVTFILAALVAFSTGSSWGTMAILYPLILPTSWTICVTAGYSTPETLEIFYNVVACVLAGSVLGDHCSPISDTTILSSLATGCNHISHVRTQMPYALTVGTVAIAVGTLPATLGVPTWILFPLAIFALWIIIRLLGKPTYDVT